MSAIVYSSALFSVFIILSYIPLVLVFVPADVKAMQLVLNIGDAYTEGLLPRLLSFS